MASIINLKRRINTAKNIAQLTHALEMVAASKMRRAKEATLANRPYADKLFFITQNLSGRIDQEHTHEFFLKSDVLNSLLLIFSPDRGLCGPLITNLAREFFKTISDKSFGSSKIKAVTIGKKLTQKVLKSGIPLVADFPFGTILPAFDTVFKLRVLVVDGFLKKEFGQVFCLYTHLESVFTQKVSLRKILPIQIEQANHEPKMISLPYLFEPSATEILDSLLPHYLEIQLWQILMESFASEQVARMNAMHNATENAQEIADILTLDYNKLRQEKVTNEILDIVTASIGTSL